MHIKKGKKEKNAVMKGKEKGKRGRGRGKKSSIYMILSILSFMHLIMKEKIISIFVGVFSLIRKCRHGFFPEFKTLSFVD